MKKLFGLFLFVVLVFAGCSCFSDGSSKEEAFQIEGMKYVPAFSDTSCVLGTNSEDANENEKPRMRIRFTYGFFMDEHEVTCGEYKALAKGHKWGQFVSCDNDNLPVTNLTFYDAVLYANAKSKSLKYDTVYTYSGRQFDSDGNCIGLEGFMVNYNVTGFRLPSEAEWTSVALQNWDPKNSWNNENSDYKAHEVCSKKGKMEFCDMAGNVSEWVGDWLGNYKDTTYIADFVGAINGGSLGERIIKGGNFNNSPENMAVYKRGDIYTVTSATKADYVGFRLVFGGIGTPVWLSSDGTASISRIGSVIDYNTIYDLFKTYKGKIALRNDLNGRLVYVDYANGYPGSLEFNDSIEIYHPDISPDGEFVAYCTGMEGVSGESEVIVRRLRHFKTRSIKLDVKNAAIPRWRVLDNGDTVIVYVSDAGDNKNETDFKKKSTWQVLFQGGKFGKPEKLFDGSYHGGVSVDGKLAVSGSRLLRANVDGAEEVWYGGEQACNVSLSQDGCKRTLFLDFGGKTGQKFTGDAYRTHERILIADSTGELVASVKAPEGFAFDHTEWVKNSKAGKCSDYVIATLSNSSGAHPKIVLVNVNDSSITDIAEGDELWHPSIWFEPRHQIVSKLNPDSAGIYMKPIDIWGSVLMRYNMQLLWKYRDSVELAIVGSSRPMNSLSPLYVKDKYFAVNFSQTPNSIFMSRDYLDRYLFDHLKKLKYVVLSLDIDFWNKVDGPKGDNFFYSLYKDYPGYVYDENHNYWKDSVPEDLLMLTEKSAGVLYENDYMGDLGRYKKNFCKTWGEKAEVMFDSTACDDEHDLYEKSLATLETIVKNAKERNVYVIGVIFPQNPRYKKTGAYGRYGLRKSYAKTLIEKIKKLEKDYSNFRFVDENKMGEHDYSDNMASDTDHLCVMGGYQLWDRLDSVIQTLK